MGALAADACVLCIAHPADKPSTQHQRRVHARLAFRGRAFHLWQSMDCGRLHLSGGDADLAWLHRGIRAGAIFGGVSRLGCGWRPLDPSPLDESPSSFRRIWRKDKAHSHPPPHPRLCWLVDHHRMAAQLGVHWLCLEPAQRGYPVGSISFAACDRPWNLRPFGVHASCCWDDPKVRDFVDVSIWR